MSEFRHLWINLDICRINETLLENTNNLAIPFGRTTNYGLKLIKVSGPSLSLDLRNLKYFSNFKISLKKHLSEKYN